MKAIQDSVAAYLQACTGVRTVADRTRARGEYPLLAVSRIGKTTVLIRVIRAISIYFSGNSLPSSRLRSTVRHRHNERSSQLQTALSEH